MPVLNIPTTGIVERFQLHLPERRFTRESVTTLYSVLSGFADILVLPQDLMDFVWTNTHIASATGTYLDDLIQPYTGFRRKSGESDNDYRERYYDFVFNYNISPSGVAQIVADYLGYIGTQREISFEDVAYFGPTGYFTNDPETLLGAEDPEEFVGYIIFSSEPDLTLLPDLAEALDHVRMSGTKIYLLWPSYGVRIYSAFERMYFSDDLVQNISYTGTTGVTVVYSSTQVGVSFQDIIVYSNSNHDKVISYTRTQTSGSPGAVTGYPSDWLLTTVSPSLHYYIIENYAFMTRREIYNSNIGTAYAVDTVYSTPYGLTPISITRTKTIGSITGFNTLTGASYFSLTGSSFYNIENSNNLNILYTRNSSGILLSSTGTASDISGNYFVETRNFISGVDVGFTRATYNSGGTQITLQTGTTSPLGGVINENSPEVTSTFSYGSISTGILFYQVTGVNYTNQSIGSVSGTQVNTYSSLGLLTGVSRTFNYTSGINLATYFWQPPHIIQYANDLKKVGAHSSGLSQVLAQQDDIYFLMANKESLAYDSLLRNTTFTRTNI